MSMNLHREDKKQRSKVNTKIIIIRVLYILSISIVVKKWPLKLECFNPSLSHVAPVNLCKNSTMFKTE